MFLHIFLNYTMFLYYVNIILVVSSSEWPSHSEIRRSGISARYKCMALVRLQKSKRSIKTVGIPQFYFEKSLDFIFSSLSNRCKCSISLCGSGCSRISFTSSIVPWKNQHTQQWRATRAFVWLFFESEDTRDRFPHCHSGL